jgi:hypothetical protein
MRGQPKSCQSERHRRSALWPRMADGGSTRAQSASALGNQVVQWRASSRYSPQARHLCRRHGGDSKRSGRRKALSHASDLDDT